MPGQLRMPFALRCTRELMKNWSLALKRSPPERDEAAGPRAEQCGGQAFSGGGAGLRGLGWYPRSRFDYPAAGFEVAAELITHRRADQRDRGGIERGAREKF